MLSFKRSGWYRIPTTARTWSDVEFHETDDAPDLKTLQAAVGGFIELVPLRGDADAFVHEEGKLEGLPFNPLGHELLHALSGLSPYDAIVGPVVVVTGKARKGL